MDLRRLVDAGIIQNTLLARIPGSRFFVDGSGEQRSIHRPAFEGDGLLSGSGLGACVGGPFAGVDDDGVGLSECWECSADNDHVHLREG